MPKKSVQVSKSDPSLPPVKATLGDLEVVVHHSRCVGSAVCAKGALDSFVINDQRKSMPTDLTANDFETLKNIARLCPTQAIFVYKNKKQIWPKVGGDSNKKQPGPNHPMKLEMLD